MFSTSLLTAISARLVLDQIKIRPTLAFSLRLLTNQYKNKCINVKRSSDGASIDIGFVNGVLDTASLLAFVGSGNGYINTWYNQGSVGSAGDFQNGYMSIIPIVSSGVLNVVGSTAALLFTVANQARLNTNSVQVVGADGTWTANAVFSSLTYSGNNAIMASDGPSNRVAQFLIVGNGNGYLTSLMFTSGGVYATTNNYTVPLNQNAIYTGTQNNSLITAYTNGGHTATPATVPSAGVSFANPVTISGIQFAYGGPQLNGNVSEAMIFPASLTDSDRSILELNQAVFYGIAGVI